MAAGLSPQDFTEQRNEAMVQTVRGLLLVNGGGAVVLLAFLQAIWSDPRAIDLAHSIILGIGFLAAGLVVALGVHPLRYMTAFRFQARRRTWVLWRLGYLLCTVASLALFASGIWVVLRGAWGALG